MQRQREDPFQLGHDQLRRLLYGHGPYGHDPLGVEAELKGIGESQLRSLVAGLGRQGAVLVLAGDPPQDVEELLEEGLTAMPWPTAAPKQVADSFNRELPRRIGLLHQATEQVVMMLGAATVPLGHPDTLPLQLLQAHLGLGMSSRLFLVVREQRGLAYDVGVHLPARCAAAPFVMHLSTSADRAAEACSCLLDEWQRCMSTKLNAKEWSLALAKFRGQDAMGRQTCSQIADRHALVLSHGLASDYVEQTIQRASALTPTDLKATAKRWLKTPSLSLVGPQAALAEIRGSWDRHPLSASCPLDGDPRLRTESYRGENVRQID